LRRQRVPGRRGRGTRAGADAGARSKLGWAVRLRCSDPFHSRRFRSQGAAGPRRFRQPALESQNEGRDFWKSDTISYPLSPSKYPWRLDDEQVMYPFYEKSVKAGINTICIHKGLLPPDYEKSFAGVWEYATAWDVGKAAKDWPQLNFVVYHSALRPFLE